MIHVSGMIASSTIKDQDTGDGGFGEDEEDMATLGAGV